MTKGKPIGCQPTEPINCPFIKVPKSVDFLREILNVLQYHYVRLAVVQKINNFIPTKIGIEGFF